MEASSNCLFVRQFRSFDSELADALPALSAARPSACRAGSPRSFEQTRQVQHLHVVAESLVRLGSAPVATWLFVDEFRSVGDVSASFISLVLSFAEASTGSAHFPASYMIGSGPTPELNQPAHVQTLHLKRASVQ